AQATGIKADVWLFSDTAPHDKENCFNAPDASQHETDHQPLLCWTLGASWHRPVSVKSLCVFVCACSLHSMTHCCGMAMESCCVATCYLDRPLNILMAPLTGGSRPEQLGAETGTAERDSGREGSHVGRCQRLWRRWKFGPRHQADERHFDLLSVWFLTSGTAGQLAQPSTSACADSEAPISPTTTTVDAAGHREGSGLTSCHTDPASQGQNPSPLGRQSATVCHFTLTLPQGLLEREGRREAVSERSVQRKDGGHTAKEHPEAEGSFS
ncbi:hypothetical protein XENOCAPTIV_006513, partial [Xenoophorus captivus]